MNTNPSRLVPLDLIEVGERLRTVDADWVSFLADSMAERGQMQAIEVRDAGQGRYTLTAGAHRLSAARLNGWTEIEAKVVNATDLEAEIREIDENLFRRDLNALDRASHLARRQEIYLDLYPETTKGKTGANIRWMRRTELSFASEVATKLGVTNRDIRRSMARYLKIAPDVREKIVGTWIAEHGTTLDALVKLGPSDQRKAITRMLNADAPMKSVARALADANGQLAPIPDVDGQQLGKMMDAWRRSGSKARREFLTWLDQEGELTAFRLARNAYKDAKVGDEAAADYAANAGLDAA